MPVQDPRTAKPRSDVYVGLLILALLAQIAGAAFLYLDYSQYPDIKPPKVADRPKGGAAPAPALVSPTGPAPAPAGMGGMAGGPPPAGMGGGNPPPAPKGPPMGMMGGGKAPGMP